MFYLCNFYCFSFIINNCQDTNARSIRYSIQHAIFLVTALALTMSKYYNTILLFCMKYHIKINMKSHQTAYIIGFIVETDRSNNAHGCRQISIEIFLLHFKSRFFIKLLSFQQKKIFFCCISLYLVMGHRKFIYYILI